MFYTAERFYMLDNLVCCVTKVTTKEFNLSNTKEYTLKDDIVAMEAKMEFVTETVTLIWQAQ